VRKAHLLAVAASALLGLAGGVVGGLVVDRNADGPDPLGLGVAQVNLSCTGDTLLVVARGDSDAELGSAVATEGKDVRYLDTSQSCDTAWVTEGKPAPRYVAYLGPYASPSIACPIRMTATHAGSAVVKLVAHTPEPEQCLCYVSRASLPTLRVGTEPTDVTSIYVRAMQRMLTDIGLNAPDHQNGLYDLRTRQQIRRLQHNNELTVNGDMNPRTWQLLIHHGCKP
jgi:putative peptidoglycan binding protein